MGKDGRISLRDHVWHYRTLIVVIITPGNTLGIATATTNLLVALLVLPETPQSLMSKYIYTENKKETWKPRKVGFRRLKQLAVTRRASF